mmetsp:Transcript_15080/g.24618  ORF Transcript_15080/g.24618 Transcript_15080/m.24618 type:complete len:115 (+) Transcript_15080:448-792(+)
MTTAFPHQELCLTSCLSVSNTGWIPPSPATAAAAQYIYMMDATASTTATAGTRAAPLLLLPSSSDETPDMDLLPSKTSIEVRILSQLLDAEQNSSTKDKNNSIGMISARREKKK